jgi:hypothetical protein
VPEDAARAARSPTILAPGEGIRIHPGLAYAQGLDKPMNSPLGYHIVQLDIPVTF